MTPSNPIFTASRTVALIVSIAFVISPTVNAAEESGNVDALTAAGVEFFEKHVRPILVQHCYECHSAEEASGGLLLDSRPGLVVGGDTGTAFVPGKPDDSLLIDAVRYKNETLQMPPNGRLPAADIKTLETWIAMGVPDPRVPATTTRPKGPTGMSVEDGREFWSFRPITDPAVPAVERSGWGQNPVDAFVLRKLKQHDLKPAAPADKRTLIRRVTFDLIGLPPTEEEVVDFLADDTTGAYEKLVQRLLNSPDYGVRWGRHWLDVARYADSNGLDENLAFGNAWRYRDYVVDAFNNDKPFDRFLVEQIAGDLLPDANLETKTATGFLVLGAKVLAEPDMDKLVMDTIDEQLDTVGKVFMGMTLGCVRCHDHKFDPVKQTDYYSLAAIFKNTRTFSDKKTGAIKHWHEHSFATEEQLEALKKIDAEIKAKKGDASSFKNKHIVKLRGEARSKATEYLIAATRFAPSAPLSVIEDIAKEFGLHPRILHHCRTHLEYNQGDPFFSLWKSLAAKGESAVEAHYRPLFSEAESPGTKTLTNIQREEARTALHDLSGFLAVPPKVEYAFDTDTLAEYNRLMEIARVVESQADDEPSVLAVGEQEATLTSLPVYIRGNHMTPGDEVPREFPQVMRVASARPMFPTDQSGRLQLAQWIAGIQHPLTARVMVNRIWGWHFGRGIVNTPENFGQLGDRPSHPELLDWLARRFAESGWSVKDLHRIILTSNAYQMSSVAVDAEASALADAEHRLLSRFGVNRLDAEPIRDTLHGGFRATGQNAGRQNGSFAKSTVRFQSHVTGSYQVRQCSPRTVSADHSQQYLHTVRTIRLPRSHDATGLRHSTVVAPQALLMMNSDLVLDSAAQLATTLLGRADATNTDRIRSLYRKALTREPAETEIRRGLAFVADLDVPEDAQRNVGQQRRHQAWTLLCQSVFCQQRIHLLEVVQ